MLGKVLSLGNMGSMLLIPSIRSTALSRLKNTSLIRLPFMRPFACSSETPVTTDVIRDLESWSR